MTEAEAPPRPAGTNPFKALGLGLTPLLVAGLAVVYFEETLRQVVCTAHAGDILHAHGAPVMAAKTGAVAAAPSTSCGPSYSASCPPPGMFARSAWEDMTEPAMERDTRMPRYCIVGGHHRDWNHFKKLIMQHPNHPFALVRYGDGERMLIRGEGVGQGTQAFSEDKFWAEPGETALGKDLADSLRGHFGQDYYYGFASPLDDAHGLKWFLQHTEQRCGFITYANLWGNERYVHTKAMLQELFKPENLKRVVIVANFEGIRKWKGELAKSNPGLDVPTMELPNDAVHVWQDPVRSELLGNASALAAANTGKTFLISGGPLAKVLIKKMWGTSAANQYVDLGSALDELLKGRVTRPYMNADTPYAKQIDPGWFVQPRMDMPTKIDWG